MPFLNHIPHYFIYIALAAWVMTFVGLLKKLVPTAVASFSESTRL